MKFLKILNSLILVSLLAGCHRETSPETSGDPKVAGEHISFPADSPQLASLELAPVESRAPASTQLSGRLIWNDDVTVRVFTPFAGRVRKITADIGQTVEKNAPLAEVESPDFGQAQADARKAEERFETGGTQSGALAGIVRARRGGAKRCWKRPRTRSAGRAEHSRAFPKSRRMARRPIRRMKFLFCKRPLAGTVVDKSGSIPDRKFAPTRCSPTSRKSPTPLFVVSDPARLWIQIDATEVDVPRLQPGSEFTFTSRAFPDETFTGRVDKVSEFIDPNTRTIKVRGSVDNRAPAAQGRNVCERDFARRRNCTTSACRRRRFFLKVEKHFVFVQEKARRIHRQEVAIGSEQAGRVLILNGLQAGQQVVTDGCILLQQLME